MKSIFLMFSCLIIFCFQWKNSLPLQSRVIQFNSRQFLTLKATTSNDLSFSQEEWSQLQEAVAADKETWEKLLQEKRNLWKQMKDDGILEKLNKEDLSEEDIEEVDSLSSKLVRQRMRTRKQNEAILMPEVVGVSKLDLLQKLKVVTSKQGSALATYSLLNELKDKGIMDNAMIEEAVMAMSRHDSNNLAVSAFRLHKKWTDDGLIQPTPNFLVRFINSCFANELISAGRNISMVAIASDPSIESSLLPGIICGQIFESVGLVRQKTATNATGAPTSAAKGARGKESVTRSTKIYAASEQVTSVINSSIDTLKSAIQRYSISDVNLVIRALGRRRLLPAVFDLLTFLEREKGAPRPDEESYEFLTNALVATVAERATARSMKELPDADADMPEVIFTGRSNVGKSSLVNFLTNRKTLASTSATPGHTTQFHFFNVNEGRIDLPSFRLVDVPGLGYAEAENNTQVSWRSTLQRYLSVRDSLGGVFHLIDSRHKVTTTDKQLIGIVARASEARRQAGKKPFQYSIVLTKTDKADPKSLRGTRRDVQESLLAGGSADGDEEAGAEEFPNAAGTGTGTGEAGAEGSVADVKIIETSALEKKGRVAVWQHLLQIVTK